MAHQHHATSITSDALTPSMQKWVLTFQHVEMLELTAYPFSLLQFLFSEQSVFLAKDYRNYCFS